MNRFSYFHLHLTVFTIFVPGWTDVNIDQVSVMERASVTLKNNGKLTQGDRITWFFNNDRIVYINGDQSKICTDVQCTERFRDRLTVDLETGSLTITNTRTTDSGEYRLLIGGSSIEKIFNMTVTGADEDSVSVSVKEGYSVTLHTGAKTSQQGRIRWYFNNSNIAHIIQGEKSICTNVECTERFNDRLELDPKTGSLTITNINTTHSGIYRLQIDSDGKIFNVSVHSVPTAERDEITTKSVVKGAPVTLDPHLMKNPNDKMTWYFNNTPIAEMTRDQSQICTDDECDKRFRDRLKLDNQTGSLTITDTRIKDSGVYGLHISSSGLGVRRRRSISITSTSIKSFRISVTDSGLSSAAAGICVGLSVALVVAVVVGVILHRRGTGTHRDVVPQNDDGL